MAKRRYLNPAPRLHLTRRILIEDLAVLHNKTGSGESAVSTINGGPMHQEEARKKLVYEVLGDQTVPHDAEMELESLHPGPASTETEPLSLEDIKALQMEFAQNPEATANKLRRFLDPNLTTEELGQALDHTRMILEEPEAELESLAVEEAHGLELPLPLDFVDSCVSEKYRVNKILINP